MLLYIPSQIRAGLTDSRGESWEKFDRSGAEANVGDGEEEDDEWLEIGSTCLLSPRDSRDEAENSLTSTGLYRRASPAC